MGQVRPLWYFGVPTDQQKENLRDGKELLSADFLIRPKPVSDEAKGIAMAFSDPGYPYVSGFIDVSKTRTATQFRNALAAVYLGEYSEFVITPEKWLSRILGEVTFIEEIEL